MKFTTVIIAMGSLASGVVASNYALNTTYDASNWYEAWTFQDAPDPTHGNVSYQNLENAKAMGLTKIVGNQVYMGVDNTTVIPADSTAGRPSIWLSSKVVFEHWLLIADFEHIPGSDCGTWPGFWSINQDNYGEIDIIEGANGQTHNDMTVHTKSYCTFDPRYESGTSNGIQCGDNVGDTGCDTQGGLFGEAFNSVGGGVYATLWNSDAISVFFWERSDIPEDISSDKPDPSGWGTPLAQFAGANGGCIIDENFHNQTIEFDTTFCGANAGGKAWNEWSTCAATTGYATCEEYVNARPDGFDESYWLVNSVKVFSEIFGETTPNSPSPSAPSPSLMPTVPSTSSVLSTSSIVSATPATSSTVSSSSMATSLPDTSSAVSDTSSTISASPATSSVDSHTSSMATSTRAESSFTFVKPTSVSAPAAKSTGSSSLTASFIPYFESSAFFGGRLQPTVSFGSAQAASSWVSSTGSGEVAPSPSSAMSVSIDGSCGEGVTCQDSSFGNCCSQAGYCGSTSDYCNFENCQLDFGSCLDPVPTSAMSTFATVAVPAATGLPISDDGDCGAVNGTTCQGSQFGSCCSEYGWCGSSDQYCGDGCQTGFGTCD